MGQRSSTLNEDIDDSADDMGDESTGNGVPPPQMVLTIEKFIEAALSLSSERSSMPSCVALLDGRMIGSTGTYPSTPITMWPSKAQSLLELRFFAEEESGLASESSNGEAGNKSDALLQQDLGATGETTVSSQMDSSLGGTLPIDQPNSNQQLAAEISSDRDDLDSEKPDGDTECCDEMDCSGQEAFGKVAFKICQLFRFGAPLYTSLCLGIPVDSTMTSAGSLPDYLRLAVEADVPKVCITVFKPSRIGGLDKTPLPDIPGALSEDSDMCGVPSANSVSAAGQVKGLITCMKWKDDNITVLSDRCSDLDHKLVTYEQELGDINEDVNGKLQKAQKEIEDLTTKTAQQRQLAFDRDELQQRLVEQQEKYQSQSLAFQQLQTQNADLCRQQEAHERELAKALKELEHLRSKHDIETVADQSVSQEIEPEHLDAGSKEIEPPNDSQGKSVETDANRQEMPRELEPEHVDAGSKEIEPPNDSQGKSVETDENSQEISREIRMEQVDSRPEEVEADQGKSREIDLVPNGLQSQLLNVCDSGQHMPERDKADWEEMVQQQQKLVEENEQLKAQLKEACKDKLSPEENEQQQTLKQQFELQTKELEGALREINNLKMELHVFAEKEQGLLERDRELSDELVLQKNQADADSHKQSQRLQLERETIIARKEIMQRSDLECPHKCNLELAMLREYELKRLQLEEKLAENEEARDEIARIKTELDGVTIPEAAFNTGLQGISETSGEDVSDECPEKGESWELRRENARLQAELAALQQRCDECPEDGESWELQRENVRLQAELSSMQQRCDEQAATHSKEIAHLTTQLAKLEAELNKRHEELALASALGELQTLRQLSDNQCRELTRQLEYPGIALQTSMASELVKLLSTDVDKATFLHDQVAQALAKIQEQARQGSEQRQCTDAAVNHYHEFGGLNEALARVQEELTQLRAWDAQRDELRRIILQAEQEHAEDVEHKNKELRELKEKTAMASSDLQQLAADNQTLHRDLAEARSASASEEEQVQRNLSLNLANLAEEQARCISLNEEAKAMNVELENVSAMAQSEDQKHQEELIAAQHHIGELYKQYRDHESDMLELQEYVESEENSWQQKYHDQLSEFEAQNGKQHNERLNADTALQELQLSSETRSIEMQSELAQQDTLLQSTQEQAKTLTGQFLLQKTAGLFRKAGADVALARQQSQVQKLTSTLEELEANNLVEHEAHSCALKEFSLEVQQYKDKLGEANSLHTKAEKDIMDLSLKLQGFEQEAADSQSVLQQVHENSEQQSRDLSITLQKTQESELAQSKTHLDEMETAANRIHQLVQEHVVQKNELSQVHGDLETVQRTWERQYRDAQVELQQQKSSSRILLDEQASVLQATERQSEELSRKNSDFLAQLSKAQSDMQSEFKKREDQRRELASFQDEVHKLQAALETQSLELHELQDLHVQKQGDLDHRSHELHEMQLTSESAHLKVKDLEDIIVQREVDLSSIHEEHSQLKLSSQKESSKMHEEMAGQSILLDQLSESEQQHASRSVLHRTAGMFRRAVADATTQRLREQVQQASLSIEQMELHNSETKETLEHEVDVSKSESQAEIANLIAAEAFQAMSKQACQEQKQELEVQIEAMLSENQAMHAELVDEVHSLELSLNQERESVAARANEVHKLEADVQNARQGHMTGMEQLRSECTSKGALIVELQEKAESAQRDFVDELCSLEHALHGERQLVEARQSVVRQAEVQAQIARQNHMEMIQSLAAERDSKAEEVQKLLVSQDSLKVHNKTLEAQVCTLKGNSETEHLTLQDSATHLEQELQGLRQLLETRVADARNLTETAQKSRDDETAQLVQQINMLHAETLACQQNQEATEVQAANEGKKKIALLEHQVRELEELQKHQKNQADIEMAQLLKEKTNVEKTLKIATDREALCETELTNLQHQQTQMRSIQDNSASEGALRTEVQTLRGFLEDTEEAEVRTKRMHQEDVASLEQTLDFLRHENQHLLEQLAVFTEQEGAGVGQAASNDLRAFAEKEKAELENELGLLRTECMSSEGRIHTLDEDRQRLTSQIEQMSEALEAKRGAKQASQQLKPENAGTMTGQQSNDILLLRLFKRLLHERFSHKNADEISKLLKLDARPGSVPRTDVDKFLKNYKKFQQEFDMQKAYQKLDMQKGGQMKEVDFQSVLTKSVGLDPESSRQIFSMLDNLIHGQHTIRLKGKLEPVSKAGCICEEDFVQCLRDPILS